MYVPLLKVIVGQRCMSSSAEGVFSFQGRTVDSGSRSIFSSFTSSFLFVLFSLLRFVLVSSSACIVVLYEPLAPPACRGGVHNSG